MNRRGFLKGTLKTALAALLATSIPIGFEVNGRAGAQAASTSLNLAARRFRGTADGKVLGSLDGGKRWQTISNLGSECQILDVFQDGDLLHAKVGFRGCSFFLKSKDGRAWYTQDYSLV